MHDFDPRVNQATGHPRSRWRCGVAGRTADVFVQARSRYVNAQIREASRVMRTSKQSVCDASACSSDVTGTCTPFFDPRTRPDKNDVIPNTTQTKTDIVTVTRFIYRRYSVALGDSILDDGAAVSARE